jgi:hypothetical protein
MTEIDQPSHAELERQLRDRRLGVGAAELHGALCGFISGGGEATRGGWLRQVLADAEAPAVAAGDLLDAMFLASRQQMESPDFGFDLLLPDAERPLIERADALLDWCRGYLGGFGLSAGAEPPLSDESRDALNDLARIAGSDLSYDDPEGDEQALAEVAEFVRVAALLMYSDCVLGPRHRRSLN